MSNETFYNLEFEFDENLSESTYSHYYDPNEEFVFGVNTYKAGTGIYIDPVTNEIHNIGGGGGGATYIGGNGINIDQTTHVISVTGQFVPGGGTNGEVLTKNGAGVTDFGWAPLPIWNGSISDDN